MSVPFVWLLFPFSRRFRLYDHTVFVTYSLCFMMPAGGRRQSLIGAGRIADRSPACCSSIPPFHMYRQLKGTYRLGRAAARCGARCCWWRSRSLAIGLFLLMIVGVGLFD